MPTENMQVGTSADDAGEANTTMYLTNAYGHYTNVLWYNGYRFVPGSSIPQGATIVSATFSFKFWSVTYDNIDATVYGEDGASPGTFTTGASNITNRTKTTASVALDRTNVGTDWQTLDVKTIIEELVGDYTIEAIVFHLDTDSAVNGRIWHEDGTDPADAPKLDIEYTTAAGGAAVQMIAYKRRRV